MSPNYDGGETRAFQGSLPPTFIDKIRLHWTQISSAFSNLDSKRSGMLTRSDFDAMSKRTGLRLSQNELDNIIHVFDRNKDGKVDFREFAAVIGDVMKPPSRPEGTSLNFGAVFDSKRPEGKRVLRVESQAMDAEEKGKPLIQTIMEGKFYTEKRSFNHMQRGGVPVPGLLLDHEFQQPMSKSLLEGLYYFPRPETSKSARTKIDFISHNRRMTREYSRMVASSSRPGSVGYNIAASSRPASARSSTFDPFTQLVQSPKSRVMTSTDVKTNTMKRPSSAPPMKFGIDKVAIDAAIAYAKSRPSSRAEARPHSRSDVCSSSQTLFHSKSKSKDVPVTVKSVGLPEAR